ncbi:hypothetical protein ACFFIO_03935 [Citricoccus parietis]
MTSPHTFPLPLQEDRSTRHEHAWRAESRHLTSEGLVLYVRCGDCGVLRVDVQENQGLPPAALSRVIGVSPLEWLGG